jgi:hypothetical protein
MNNFAFSLCGVNFKEASINRRFRLLSVYIGFGFLLESGIGRLDHVWSVVDKHAIYLRVRIGFILIYF